MKYETDGGVVRSPKGELDVMLFSLLHNSWSTTILTIYRETNSLKWTAVATLLPLLMGFALTFGVTQAAHLLGWG